MHITLQKVCLYAMKNIFCLLFFVPLLVFQACTTDAGYDPSSRYIDKKVDYVVDSAFLSWSYEIPKCDKSLEGTVIFIERELDVYACIDSVWTFCRKLSAGATELYDAILYDESNGMSKESENKEKIDIPYETSSIVDSRDGHKYKTVIVDDMEWMAENLDYDDEESNRVARQCSAKFGEKHCRQYRMYYAVGGGSENSLAFICPEDFHVPFEYEWEKLFEAVGGEEIAGKMLKDENFSTNYKYRGVNAISFSVLATGHGAGKYESYVGEAAAFRTASGSVVTFGAASNGAGIASAMSYFDGEYTNYSSVQSSDFYSVRCMRAL